MKPVESFIIQRTNDLLPELFPQLWTMACEYGWDDLVQKLKKYALKEMPGDLPDGLENEFEDMSTRGRVRAASSLLALLVHARSSLRDIRYHYVRLRAWASSRIRNFKLRGLCSDCKAKVAQRTSAILELLSQEFPALRYSTIL